jgi:hypothetical protein
LSRRIVRASPNCRSRTNSTGAAAPTASYTWGSRSGTSGTSLASPSSESLIASTSPLRRSIATSALAPISRPLNPRVGARRLAAFLIFLPSSATTAKASKQAGSGSRPCPCPAGISSASRAVPRRSSARLTATGMFASLR